MLLSSTSTNANMRKRRLNEGAQSELPFRPFMIIGTEDAHNRVVVHIRGVFPTCDAITQEIATLYDLSQQYSTVLIYINSPGGDGATMSELLNAFSLFKTVITVGAGMVCSAGFFLWCSGDIRVVQDHSGFMAHRESYAFEGKTPQHADFANFNEVLFSRLISELCDEVLTIEEQSRIRTTEVFLNWQDLIEREVAISWSQFIDRDRAPLDLVSYTEIDGQRYRFEGEYLVSVDEDGTPIARFLTEEVVYDVPHKMSFPVDDSE